jgi:hypothetical protein
MGSHGFIPPYPDFPGQRVVNFASGASLAQDLSGYSPEEFITDEGRLAFKNPMCYQKNPRAFSIQVT